MCTLTSYKFCVEDIKINDQRNLDKKIYLGSSLEKATAKSIHRKSYIK